MSKSLTEVAKAVLMKEEAANMASLKPNGGIRQGAEANPMSNGAQMVGDAPKAPGEGSNVGAAASGSVKKDTSKSSQSNVAAEKPKKQMEVMEEDVEIEEDYDLNKKKEGEEIAKRAKKLRTNRPEGIIRDFGNLISQGKIKDAVTGDDTAADYEKAMRQLYGKDKRWKGAIEKITVREEALEEEIELSEELEAFIDEMIEEGYDEDQIAEAIEENFEFVTEDADSEESVMEEYEVDMSEDMEALFAGEELSEEFKEKAKTIFEAAVKHKLEEELAVLEEAFAATLEEQAQEIQESLTENVDDYLNYVVEQWVSDNEVAIESGLRTELMEDFVSGMRNLFAEHYIDIPEEKVSVVEEMASKVEELEAKLNEEIERNVALNKMLNEAYVNDVLDSACEGLTATQAEKLKSLAEGIEYADANEYAQKVQTLRESYFTNSVRTENVLDTVEVSDGKSMISEDLSGPMANYVKALGRTLSK